VHSRHDSLAHHRRVEAELDASVLLQLKKHVCIARSPEVLIFFEFVIAAPATVFLVSAEKDCATEVDQDEHLEFLDYF